MNFVPVFGFTEQSVGIVELRFEGVAELRADLVTAIADSRADCSFQVPGLRAKPAVHFAHTFFDDALHGASPSGVENADCMLSDVNQNHRHAIRREDTEENSGVLVYVQLVDRRIEIVADRGIARRVAQAEWDAVCRAMEHAFKQHQYEAGALQAIAAVTEILAHHFPASGANPNELPDKPAVL